MNSKGVIFPFADGINNYVPHNLKPSTVLVFIRISAVHGDTVGGICKGIWNSGIMNIIDPLGFIGFTSGQNWCTMM